MNCIIAASTDVGNVKLTNQDSFNAKVIKTPDGEICFAVLCDGMGGLEKGELASATVIETFRRWSENALTDLLQQGLTDHDVTEEWDRLIQECNNKIKSYGYHTGISLGTTITAMLLTEDRYYIVNVGDTRAYEIGEQLRVITRDQTLVAQEVEQGLLTEEEAEADPRRSILLQCIGASENVYPEMFFGDVTPGNVYMLCSDGFRHEISAEEIYDYLHPDVLLSYEDMVQNMNYLIQLNKQREERDNITVLTVRTY